MIWAVVVGTFFWFFWQWAFRILALVTVGRVVGRATSGIKKKLGGMVGDDGDGGKS